MKKTLLSVITFFAVFLFVMNVNAKLTIENSTKAKAPEAIPATTDVLHGTVTEDFDFSKLQFAPESGSTNISGMAYLKKIILGKMKNIDSTTGLTLDSTLSNWFTAYCLDNAKKYPIYGLLTSSAYSTSTDDDVKLEIAILAALANDSNYQNAVKNKSALNNGNIDSISLVDINTGDDNFELNATDTVSGVLAKIDNLTESVTIKIKKVDFYRGNSPTSLVLIASVSAADISGDATAETYDLTFKGKDVLLDEYSVTANSSITGYDHALWIIEHSYPTLALRTSVEAAGANYEALRKEICELEGHSFDDTELTCTGLANLDDYVENYVYGTIQYAIWKSTAHTVDGETLGSSVVNSSELNKLYKYLIKDRSEYSGYSTRTFANKITIKTPKDGDELYKETSSAYVYGPYKASYDVLSGGDMTVSVTNADKTGIKIVNESGTEISKISNGDSFYIECAKSAKISSASVSVKLNDASVFDPLTNRGRIYVPKYSIEQNVMSGGKIVNKNLESTVDLLVNPKTGVENVAILLMVTLVAFTLAYLLLSYKQKSIQLS